MSSNYLKNVGNIQKGISSVEDIQFVKLPMKNPFTDVHDLKRGKHAKTISDLTDQKDALKYADRYCSDVQRNKSFTLCDKTRISSNQDIGPVSRITSGRSATYQNISLNSEASAEFWKPNHAQQGLNGPSRSGERSEDAKQPLTVGHESTSELGCCKCSEHGSCKAVGVRSCCGIKTSSSQLANVYESRSFPVSKNNYGIMTSKLSLWRRDSRSGLTKSMLVPSPTGGCWTNVVCESEANFNSLASRSYDSMICKVKHQSDADAKICLVNIQKIKTDSGRISYSKSELDSNNLINRNNSHIINNIPELCGEDCCELESKCTGKFSELSIPVCCNMDIPADECYRNVAKSDHDSVVMTKTGTSRCMRNAIKANSDLPFDGSVGSSQSFFPSDNLANWKGISSSLSLDRVRRSWSNCGNYGSQTSSSSDPSTATDFKSIAGNINPGQTITRALLTTQLNANTTHRQFHEVEKLLDDFKQQCSEFSEVCGGAQHLNNVELRLLRQFESVNLLCRRRLEIQRQALITSEAFHSLVNKTKSMTSSLCSTYDFEQTEDRIISGTLLTDINSDFDTLLAHTAKLRRLKQKADQLIKFLHEIECGQFGEKPSDEYFLKDAKPEESWNPIVATVLTTTASNVANGQLDGVEVGLDKMAGEFAGEESSPSEMINRCRCFEQTLDCLTEIVDSAPEFLELHCVERRMELIRYKLSDVKQLSLYSKFTGLHAELESAMAGLQEAFDKIDMPLVSEGEQCIHDLMREAQLVYEAALSKLSSINDLITVGQNMSQVLSTHLSLNLLKAVKKTKISCKMMETSFLRKVQELKHLLRLTGVDLMAYGSFDLIDWKNRFTAHLHAALQRPIDFFRTLTKGDFSRITRRNFVGGIVRSGFQTTLEEIYCMYDLMDTTCANQVCHQEFNNIIVQHRPIDYIKAQLDVSTPAVVVEERIQKAIEVQSEMCRCLSPLKVVRTCKGLYKFGDREKKYLLKMVANGSVLVRVGSGWETLAELLKKIDPCRETSKFDVNSKCLPKSSRSFSTDTESHIATPVVSPKATKPKQVPVVTSNSKQ